MYQNWTALLINNDDYRQYMVSEIDGDYMDDIILNAGSVLYYISEWLMNQLTKVKKNVKNNEISNILSKNRATQSDSQDDATESLPNYVFQKREVQEGKLIWALPAFFHFVWCVIYAIFITNISDCDKFGLIRDKYSKRYKKWWYILSK